MICWVSGLNRVFGKDIVSFVPLERRYFGSSSCSRCSYCDEYANLPGPFLRHHVLIPQKAILTDCSPNTNA
jgi:hypothetical protein